MKLNKDNYELVMFDLLEGNLSEVDELRVMEQIEGDEFLFREWKLFKSTVLIADKEVVYKGKSGLLRKEKVAIVPMYSRWMAAAASVAILAMAFVFWPSSTPPQVATDTEVSATDTSDEIMALQNDTDDNGILEEEESSEIHKETFSPEAKLVEQKSKATKPDVESDNYSKSRQKQIKTEKMLVREKVNSGKEAIKTLEDNVVEVPKKQLQNEPKTELIAQLPTKKSIELEDEINPSLEPKVIEKNTKKDVVAGVPQTRAGKIIAFVTNQPLQRITTTTAAILVKIRNPKLKVKPDFKSSRPSLNIEFESEGYEVVASLQPFKNKNN